MFIEMLALIFGGALMGVGVCLIKCRENIKERFPYSGRVGSCLYILGLSILASWELDDLIRDRLPDAFEYVSLNTFWAILWAGIGLSFVLEDLKKVWNTKPNQKKPEKNENPNAKVINQKDK